MPEWILVVLALAGLSLLGLVWTPLLVVALPLFAVAAAFVPVDAVLAARRARLRPPPWRERCEAARADRAAQRPPAVRAAARATRPRPDAVAAARQRRPGAAGGRGRSPSGASTGCSRAQARDHRGRPARGRGPARGRRRVRPLGPRGPRRLLRLRAAAAGRRGARRRTAARAVPALAADRAGSASLLLLLVRGGRARRGHRRRPRRRVGARRARAAFCSCSRSTAQPARQPPCAAPSRRQRELADFELAADAAAARTPGTASETVARRQPDRARLRRLASEARPFWRQTLGRARDQPARDAARPADADPDQGRRRQRPRLAAAARVARSARPLIRGELGHGAPGRDRAAASPDRSPRPASGARPVRCVDDDGAAA